jgi:hypothetical protein
MELFSYILSQSVPCWCIEKRLIKLFMVTKSFLLEYFGSFRYKIVSFANRDSSTSFLPISILLFLLPALLF